MVDEERCAYPMKDGPPCGHFLRPHCTSPTCDWEKCDRPDGIHVIRPDGHVMGDPTWKAS